MTGEDGMKPGSTWPWLRIMSTTLLFLSLGLAEAQAQTGTLNVTVRTSSDTICASGGLAAGALVIRYDTNWIWQDQKTTDGSGVATFIAPSGNHNFEVYHSGEFWRYEESVFIWPWVTNAVTLTRREPYATSVRIYNRNTNADVTGQTVAFGTPLQIRIHVRNCSQTSRSTRVRLTALGTHASCSGGGGGVAGPATLSAHGGNATYWFDFTPDNPGTYRISFEVDAFVHNWAKTDWWPCGVAVTVLAPPSLCRSPSTLSRTILEGQNAASQSIQVGNCGGGSLSYSISDNVNWLAVTSAGGSSSGGMNTHTVSYSTAHLGIGTYTATITISASGASNSPQTIPVTLTVTPDPAICYNPSSIDVSVMQDQNAGARTFSIWNCGGQTLQYAISDNVGWLSVSPSSGSSSGGSTTHTIHFDTAWLSAGTYSATITISGTGGGVGNSPQTLPVALTVQPPTLGLSGRITACAGGVGLADASVQWGSHTTTTNAGGYYDLGTALVCQTALFTVSAQGYGSKSYNLTPACSQANVHDDCFSQPWVAYCFGDGFGGACPCGNWGGPGEGCANSTGQGAVLSASGTASIALGDLVLWGSGTVPGQAGLYLQGSWMMNNGNGIAFGDGLQCAGGSVVRLQVRASDLAGGSYTTVPIAAVGGASAGITQYYQLWYRDGVAAPCGAGFNLSNALRLTWHP